MPHRTVFQVGKKHAHQFTHFIGGFVLGVIVAGAVAWAWMIAEDSNVEIEDALTGQKAPANQSASPRPRVSPTASPSVSF